MAEAEAAQPLPRVGPPPGELILPSGRLSAHVAVQSTADSAGRMALEPVSRSAPLPVSFSQRRLWVLNQLDPQSAAFHAVAALRLRGPLQDGALERALDHLVARHEAFRTTFEFGEDEPLARIGAVRPADLVRADLSAFREQGREIELTYQATTFTSQPFDLTHGPLYRFMLVRLAEQDHALILVMHRIVGDDGSMDILLDQLPSLYRCALNGHAAPPYPGAPIDFVDYASWQRKHFDALAGQVHDWLQQLSGMGPLNLNTDAAVAQRLTSRGDSVRRALSDDEFDTIRQFCASRQLPPFVALLAAFQALLARYCGQEDVVVGTPIAGRAHVEAVPLVGAFANTLALRAHVQPAQSFAQLALQVRERYLAAIARSDVPFDYLMERLHGGGSGGASAPVIRAMFAFSDSPRQVPRLDGLDVRFMTVDQNATQFDLALTVEAGCDRTVTLRYSTELFATASAQAMLDTYLHLLHCFVAQPDQPLRVHPNASPDDLEKLARWNRTEQPYPRDSTIHALLSAQREARGTALLQLPGERMSYPQLWSRVYRIARLLRDNGVRRGCLVGLCVERDPSMVVAQLAILCAGAAYVPLDPAYPVQRLHDMARDASLTLLVTWESLSSLWQGLDLQTLRLDRAHDEWMARSDAALPPDPERDARPEDPAYVIYTSGSTGKPKGVVVPHRAVVNLLESMRREPGLRDGDVLLAVTTLSFDMAVPELLLPLCTGATVVLATREQATDGEALLTLMDLAGVTMMQATPATWRMVIDAGWNGSADFKAWIGAESLSLHLARELTRRCGELWNLYGPTETTVWSTCWKVPAQLETISIGRPIANTVVHVLDAQGNPCPTGVSGEIFIGGDGVTLGYLHRPELTVERFIADPFSPHENARLYRTGDRGRWRHDGLIEHQGRLDFQVKVRGHRIELGEIEARLQSHDDVLQCLVMAREDRPGDTRLVAYVVGRTRPLDAPGLKDHLRGALPDYMLPQHFVALDALPLLPNGKVNRHALPAPFAEPRDPMTAGDRPSTPAESALARIWAEVLGMRNVEIARLDNFFDIGGDSLKVGRVVVAFQRACGVRLEARRFIFESLSQLSSGVEMAASHAASEKPAARFKQRWLGRWARSRPS